MKARLRSDVLRRYLLQNNLAYKDLADLCGVTPAAASQWNRRKTNVGTLSRKRLMAATGLSFDELFEIVEA